MTRLQFLLAKLAEEATEVAQIALKTQQFGAQEKCLGQPLTNFERTHCELNDFMAIVEMLNEECGFGYVRNLEAIQEKKLKVNTYADYSASLGLVVKRN